jgi:hypothetical protein
VGVPGIQFFSRRVWKDYDAIGDACSDAWNKLMHTPEQIASIATRERSAASCARRRLTDDLNPVRWILHLWQLLWQPHEPA